MAERETNLIVASARFKLDPSSTQRDGYAAHMSGWAAEITDNSRALESTVWNLGPMVIILNDFPARKVARSLIQARTDQLDHYQVHLPLAERGVRLRLGGDAREVMSPAGAPLLMDLSRPYDMEQGAGRTVQAYMPREVLEELLPNPRELHGTLLQGVTGVVLAELLVSLVKGLPNMTVAEAADAAKSAMHLVAASLSAVPDNIDRARPAVQASLLRQACRFIEIHLKEPEVSVEQACAALKISRATLYRLLEPYGGFANHVRERRLVRMHGLLAAREQHTSLTRIAEDHGFSSAAQFSRAFRRQFGYSPSEARSAATLSVTTTPENADPATGIYSLATWLRPLRG